MTQASNQPGGECSEVRGAARREHADALRGLSRREVLTLHRRRCAQDTAWSVCINPHRCCDCGACVRVCQRSALRRRGTDDAVIYDLIPSRCDGCSQCVEVCAEHAVEITQREEPTNLVEAARLLVECCSRCGERGAGLRDGHCMICRQDVMRLAGQGGHLR